MKPKKDSEVEKKKVIWVCALLLLLAGCSSDDDNLTINDKNILGYWENETSVNGRGGLLFNTESPERF